MSHAQSSTPLEPITRVGKPPAPGKKYGYHPEAHPITDPGFDDSKNWFKNTVQKDQLYIQKRNLPTHRVMPYDRVFNFVAYSGASALFFWFVPLVLCSLRFVSAQLPPPLVPRTRLLR